ncbi:uncharacterized protein B0I36DRAFT_358965 [Microdochium trichocladiopsis]|uniref:Uncharacterized protein n=1 Tax=Microdochium trichocladiopsis TaxID=1682393 RepID=A0A9P8YG01_9PEZI|nr:uncharacterized protein B0I36DRAFT_358965 [Microdochium trichocladiopsis]KAH7037238.1 hypothetical protein B0I36DRAFT_358965 [Microdochium trichocladiopsis]
MHNVESMVRQSGPVDLETPYDTKTVAGKTVLLTGGASGFGAGFARRWAALGANLMIGDISDTDGEALVAELRQSTGSPHHHYFHCDVTDWSSQVKFFKEAAERSPHGGIDVVVANAGVKDTDNHFDNPTRDLSQLDCRPPNLTCIDVNITGVAYTTHLALFWLPRSSGKDKQIMLLGSVASLVPLPPQIQYTMSKHAVLGLFRTLRGLAWQQNIRVNLLCPYFIKTPIIPPMARILLAGGGMGVTESVVEAATRFLSDESIIGRALVVGPRVRIKEDAKNVEDEFEIVGVVDEDAASSEANGPSGCRGTAAKDIWEIYAHDYEALTENLDLEKALNNSG